MAKATIPLLDFGDLGPLPTGVSSLPEERLSSLSGELIEGLRRTGIVYIRNHGIPQELVS